MTIHISIKNEDTRANAIVEVISTDEYISGVKPIVRFTKSEAILAGGETAEVYVTSTMKLEVIERMNG